jgi:hypothetical protein
MQFDKFPVITGKISYGYDENDISQSLTEDIADYAERKAKLNDKCNKHSKSNPN